MVELQSYTDLDNLVNLAIKVEREKGRRWGNNKPNSNPNNKWDTKWNSKADPNKVERVSSQKGMFPPKQNSNTMSHVNNESNPKTNRHRDIKCFKCKGRGHYANDCVNKNAMIVRGDEIMYDSEHDDDEMPPLEDCSDVENEHYVYPV